jgi:hypothetical protein
MIVVAQATGENARPAIENGEEQGAIRPAVNAVVAHEHVFFARAQPVQPKDNRVKIPEPGGGQDLDHAPGGRIKRQHRLTGLSSHFFNRTHAIKKSESYLNSRRNANFENQRH